MIALVYRGPAAVKGCPEAVAELLAASRWGFDVRYVGPDGEGKLSEKALSKAVLYAQPGGGSLSHGYKHMRRHRDAIREFVSSGGRYLGFCLGGYLAGATPGFALLPGDTDQYIASSHAELDTEDDALIDITWRGEERRVYFQDGPYFHVRKGAEVDVLATYANGRIAALVTEFGGGRVGVVGPHPEATDDWYTDAGLLSERKAGKVVARARQLGLDLVDTVMAR
ncbi:BPL-N domain-containing protein [Amycolatopsis pigmentata]|uniref:BPL-N domain-containing protein n=1 Tax=Amycolatopsis pigmentata TaxID=450801 RepID=A0ABW5G154_9PSEU